MSLWEIMDLILASEPVTCSALLQTLAANRIANAEPLIPHLGSHKELCDRLGLSITSERLMKLMLMIPMFPRGDQTARLLAKQAEEIDRIYQEELRSKRFLFIPPERVVFYRQERPFGDSVFDAFHSARYDLTEASNCRSLSRPTACVFHCMRALEIILKTLARDLGVRRPIYEFENEQTIITHINQKITAKKQRLNFNKKSKRVSTRKKNTDLIEKQASLAASLEACKDAWRNSVAHARRIYTEEEAALIYDAVGLLLRGASAWLKESA